MTIKRDRPTGAVCWLCCLFTLGAAHGVVAGELGSPETVEVPQDRPADFDNGYDPEAARASFPANRTVYIGAQLFSPQIIDRDINSSRESTPGVLQSRFGKFLNPYVSAEARLGFGTGLESGDARVDRMGGLYFNAYWPFNDRVAIYVMTGPTYAEGSTRADSDNQRRSWSEAGLSYGVGLNLFTRGGFGVYAEYVWYLDEELSPGEVEIEGWGLGGQVAF